MFQLNEALFKKYCRESLLLWFAIAIGLFGFAWFRVWIVSEVDTARFQQILELLPKDWRRFSSVDFDWIISYVGRTALTLDEPMIMMLIGVWAIVKGSDVVSGELNRGTMEMVLAQPISRQRIFIQHAVLSILGLAVLVLLIWLAMALAVSTTSIDIVSYPTIRIPMVGKEIPITFLSPKTVTIGMIEKVHPIQFLPGIINLFFFGCFLTCVSMMFSSWDRFRWRTLGIVVGTYFLQAMIKVGAMASESFSWLKYFTYFTLYEPALSIEVVDTRPEQAWGFFRYDEFEKVAGLGPVGLNLTLLILGLAFLMVGMKVFSRRDLPAPL